MKVKLPIILAVTFLLLTSSCQESKVSAGNSATPTKPPAPREIIIPQTPSPESDNQGVDMPDFTQTLDPIVQNLVQIAMKDMSERFKIDMDQIHLTSVEAVTWSDSSLGCPQMGLMYTQMITPGYKLILEADGKTYPYHTDERTRVIWCGLQPEGGNFITPSP